MTARHLPALVAGIALVTGFAHAAITVDGPAVTCRTVTLHENTDGSWTGADVDALTAVGWFSDPTDGAERLYSPECAR